MFVFLLNMENLEVWEIISDLCFKKITQITVKSLFMMNWIRWRETGGENTNLRPSLLACFHLFLRKIFRSIYNVPGTILGITNIRVKTIYETLGLLELPFF